MASTEAAVLDALEPHAVHPRPSRRRGARRLGGSLRGRRVPGAARQRANGAGRRGRARDRRARLGADLLAAVRRSGDGRHRRARGGHGWGERDEPGPPRRRRFRDRGHRRPDPRRLRRRRHARGRSHRRRRGRAARGRRAVPARPLDWRGRERRRAAAARGPSVAPGGRCGGRRRGSHRARGAAAARRDRDPDGRRDPSRRFQAGRGRAPRHELHDARCPGRGGRMRGAPLRGHARTFPTRSPPRSARPPRGRTSWS